MSGCLTPARSAEVLAQYMQMVAALGFDTEPDYDALRDVLRAGLGPGGVGCARLEFSCAAAAAAAAKLVSVAPSVPVPLPRRSVVAAA